MLKSLFYSGPSLQILHTAYAKQGRIDTAAAIQSQSETIIHAPVTRVWQILADAPNWSTWMPDVKTVRLDSTVVPDAAFTWINGPLTIKSTFAIVEPEKELTWTGMSSGAKAVDRHTLEVTNGGTRVFTEESMAGPFVILFFNSQRLRAGQQAFLAALKQLAEKTS